MSKHFNGTRKDYAVTLGLAKAGKGRMSREAHAAVDKAIAEGMTFTDVRVSKDAAPKGPVVAKDGPQDAVENPYGDAFMRYPMDQLFTYEDDKGKSHVVNARQACMGCGYSLVGHTCNSPVVLTKHGKRPVRPKGE